MNVIFEDGIKMRMIPQLDEWQGNSGKYYVGYIKSFTKDMDNWMIPCRAMKLPPAEWVDWLIKNYHPDDIFYNDTYTFVGYSWNDYASAHKYKLEINKIIKQQCFMI